MESVHSGKFSRFGKVIEGDYSDVVEYLETHTDIPETGNIYIADDSEMHNLHSYEYLQKEVYDNEDIQMGYCNGNNSLMNCLEWHSCPEINIATSDIALFVARAEDLDENNCIDSSEVGLFELRKGEALLLYSGTMHFSPCKLEDKGFKCAIILHKGVNSDLDNRNESELLFKNDKFLIAHNESRQASMGACIGIKGINREVKYKED